MRAGGKSCLQDFMWGKILHLPFRKVALGTELKKVKQKVKAGNQDLSLDFHYMILVA